MNSLQIVQIAELFAEKTGRSTSTVSRLASGSGATINRLRDGREITIGRANRMLRWFSSHWPADLAWPADIPRPAPRERAPAGKAA